MRQRLIIWAFTAASCFAPASAIAGGPLLVGGPAVGARAAFGHDGQPFTWNPAAMPIQYRVDPGPLATAPTGSVVIDNASGLQRVQNMFGVWQAVPTAVVSFTNAGPILPAGSYKGGDLNTAVQFNDVIGSCQAGVQSPVIFDADGSILSALGLPDGVIGFTIPCAQDSATGFFISAAVMMNGKFQDGVNSPSSVIPNFELTANEFDQAITHEIGHLLGLDHSQINLDLLTQNNFPCDVDSLAGLPLMFPILVCQARKDAGLPVLAPDDVSWISKLYPSAQTAATYGVISGTIFFSDGVSHVQGANVIARLVDDPSTSQDESRRVAVSCASGYLFTGNPGQSVTAILGGPEDNTNGDMNGSRNSTLIGHYEISVPPGTYTVEVESISSDFTGGSSLGPLADQVPLPGAAEFWNKDESAFDFPLQRDTITVHPGDNKTGIDIILNNTAPRFDQFEDSGALMDGPLAAPLQLNAEVRA